jgi:hypothetical protein
LESFRAGSVEGLWLIDKDGNHRFIEVKLPTDWVKPHQLAGLAAISCCLVAKAGKNVAVEVFELSPEGKSFDDSCGALGAG